MRGVKIGVFQNRVVVSPSSRTAAHSVSTESTLHLQTLASMARKRRAPSPPPPPPQQSSASDGSGSGTEDEDEELLPRAQMPPKSPHSHSAADASEEESDSDVGEQGSQMSPATRSTTKLATAAPQTESDADDEEDEEESESSESEPEAPGPNAGAQGFRPSPVTRSTSKPAVATPESESDSDEEEDEEEESESLESEPEAPGLNAGPQGIPASPATRSTTKPAAAAPQPESESEDEEEGDSSESESEDPVSNPLTRSLDKPAPPAPLPPLSDSDSEEEEEGESSEEEPEIPEPVPKNALATKKPNTVAQQDKKPVPSASMLKNKAKVDAPQAEPGADEEEEEEGESSELEQQDKIEPPAKKTVAKQDKKRAAPPDAAPSGKPKKKAKVNAGIVEPEATPTGNGKEKAELEKVPRVQTRSATANKLGSKLEKSKVVARRKWSNNDTMTILKNLAAYVQKEAALPDTSQGMYDLVVNQLERENASSVDVYERVRTLKKKYERYCERGVMPVEAFENKVYKLSDAIWGQEAIAAAAASKESQAVEVEVDAEEDGDGGAAVQGTRRDFHELQKLYPDLAAYVESWDAQNPGREKLKFLFEFIGDEEARTLEANINPQRKSVVRASARLLDYYGKVLRTVLKDC